MAVVEVRPILLLDSETIGVIIPGLDGVLCDTRNAVIPRPINLVNSMPMCPQQACQYRLGLLHVSCRGQILILPVHSCLESELVVHEHLYLVSLIRFNHGPWGLAIDGEYRSAMSIPSVPLVSDCKVVGPLHLAFHCRE